MENNSPRKIHLCIDGYQTDTSALRNEELLGIYFRSIKKSAFTRILYFPDDLGVGMEGVMGCLIGPGYHTTVHTYTNQNKLCYFLDFFGFEEKKHRNAMTYLEGSYSPTYSMQHTILRQEQTHIHGVSDASNPSVYGPHLMVELRAKRGDPLTMKYAIRDFLDALPAEIGMHPLTQTFQIQSKEWISSLRVIVESHLSIHYHIPTSTLFLDVFSCKAFDYKKVLYLLKEKFAFRTSTHGIIERGHYFPREIPVSQIKSTLPTLATAIN